MTSNPPRLPKPEGAKPSQKVRVMIVDDDPTNCKLLVDLVAQEGYEPTVAMNGSEALNRLVHKSEEVDVVLLDLMMPGVSGLEVLEELAERRLLTRISVAVISAVTDRLAIQSALDLGALDYVTKPFDRHEMIARLRGLVTMRLRLKEIQARGDRLESMMSDTNSVLYTFDDDAAETVSYISENSVEILGIDPATFFEPNFSIRRYINPDDRDQLTAYLNEVRRGITGAQEFRYRHGSGSWRRIRFDAHHFGRVDGLGDEFVVALADVSDQPVQPQKSEEPDKPEFITLRVKTASVVAMKDDFRSLLNSIVEFTELLDTDRLTEEQRENSQRILLATHQILGRTTEPETSLMSAPKPATPRVARAKTTPTPPQSAS